MAAQPNDKHYVLGNTLLGDYPGMERAIFGMGCFWGAERKLWTQDGVLTTSVGYMGGHTENPTYRQVCGKGTNHAEVVYVIFDPAKTTYRKILDVFWGWHDPTQLNRQGADVGTQYRSCAFYFSEEQKNALEETKADFQKRLTEKGYGQIVTQIEPASNHVYYLAEDYHQQYLAKNPDGYCGLKGTGCYVPTGVNLLGDN